MKISSFNTTSSAMVHAYVLRRVEYTGA